MPSDTCGPLRLFNCILIAGAGGDAAAGGAGSARKPKAGNLLLPENQGLLSDENYTYLSLLKRYVLYGPTLGFTNPTFGKAPTNGGSMAGSKSISRNVSSVSALPSAQTFSYRNPEPHTFGK